MPTEPTTFLEGLRTIATCGNVHLQVGMAAHLYVANRSMARDYFYDADGELLIVPQEGSLALFTKCGRLKVGPGEIALVPREMKFKVDLIDGRARGYVCAGISPYRNGVRSGRTAWPIRVTSSSPWRRSKTSRSDAASSHNPPDGFTRPTGPVAGRRGGLERQFRALQIRSAPLLAGRIDPVRPSRSIDLHVLTSASDTPGTANIDFVTPPERGIVMEDPSRPPWYHMNFTSEFMGLVYGVYDAKPERFRPGGMSLHNAMTPHGPDAEDFERTSTRELKPEWLSGTMAFMFETRYPLAPTGYASGLDLIDVRYAECWDQLGRHFR